MTNTDIRERAERTIKTITAQLNLSLIKSLFDEPIDSAARQFRHQAGCPVSNRTFHKVLADFIVHIYGLGLNARWKLSTDPLGEVIALLEFYYQSNYGRGYIAAALDANDAAQGGMDTTLYTLKEIIKRVEHQKYFRSIFATNIEAADWDVQCEMVRVLVERYRPFLPEQIGQCQPWELISQIPSMICLCLGADSTLQEILSYPHVSTQRADTVGADVSSVVMSGKTDQHERS